MTVDLPCELDIYQYKTILLFYFKIFCLNSTVSDIQLHLWLDFCLHWTGTCLPLLLHLIQMCDFVLGLANVNSIRWEFNFWSNLRVSDFQVGSLKDLHLLPWHVCLGLLRSLCFSVFSVLTPLPPHFFKTVDGIILK